MSEQFPAQRLVKGLVRASKLSRGSRVLDVGPGHGDVVRMLRRRKMDAFGLFDGTTTEHDDNAAVPARQPACLHQSIPFPAQSFDAVVVRQTTDYDGPLSTPEACTTTANLLAALKPGGVLVYCGPTDFGDMKQHLNEFPGQGRQLTLGTGTLLYLVLRLFGLIKPGLPALKFTIPHESITRLEWHRLARTAVANLNRPAVDNANEAAQATTESPAA